MAHNVFKIFLCTLLFVVITVRESNSDARSLSEKVFNIFKRNGNLPQASEYLGVNSSEIIGPDECVCKRGECIVTEYGDTVCQCPPGYGNYTQSECVECKCGEDTNCTFSVYGGKFCDCKEGYIQENGKCEKCICGEGSSKCTVNHYGEKVCICKEGYTQVRGKCEKCNCGPNTRCRIDDYRREICSCRRGYRLWNGKCEDVCSPNPCQNGGECKVVDGDYNCICKFPNSGMNCDKECSCGPNGKCSFSINGKNVCQCQNGFAEYEGLCKECNCGPNTSCRFGEFGHKLCSCLKGYRYVDGKCEDPCTPNPCENGGKCSVKEGGYSCACKFPYSGKNCKKGCSCGPYGECSFAINGKKICDCRNGFSEFEGLCKECSCGPHSFCFFNNYGEKRCVCVDGYIYNNGKCEEGKKENIVVPALLGAILVSILFGICFFTCLLYKK